MRRLLVRGGGPGPGELAVQPGRCQVNLCVHLLELELGPQFGQPRLGHLQCEAV